MSAPLADYLAPLARWPADRRTAIRVAALAGLGAVLAVGALLATRRLTGHINTGLSLPQLVVVAAVVAALIFGGRVAWQRTPQASRGHAGQQFERILGWTGSLAVLLMGLGCSFAGAQLSDWLVWAPLLIVDHWQRHTLFTAAADAKSVAVRPVRPTISVATTPSIPAASLVPPSAAEPESPTEQTVQQLTRVRESTGAEVIRGSLRAEFAKGQRHATLHVGFCPPLAALPEIDAEPVDGPDATVKIVQAFAHGARLEVRLDEAADEPCHVTVEFAASPAPAPVTPRFSEEPA